MNTKRTKRGFTLIEIVVVLAIFGILTLGAIPSVLNSLEVRALDNTVREILSAFQQGRWQAVNTKLNHRLLFVSISGAWYYRIERENTSGTWTLAPGTMAKRIPPKFTLTLTLPAALTVTFMSTGIISGYDGSRNQVSLSSPKLAALNQPNRRILRFFPSGSFRLIEDTGV
jgi:prepilin-type N-terminal cleavage/methylation domain-containing protein